MAKPKRLTPFERRSRAAKKGWRTRRAHLRAEREERRAIELESDESFQRRSEAAKKGWKLRNKKRELQIKVVKNFLKLRELDDGIPRYYDLEAMNVKHFNVLVNASGKELADKAREPPDPTTGKNPFWYHNSEK